MRIAAATLEFTRYTRRVLVLCFPIGSSGLPSCPPGTYGDMTCVILGVCCLKCGMGKFYEIQG